MQSLLSRTCAPVCELELRSGAQRSGAPHQDTADLRPLLAGEGLEEGPRDSHCPQKNRGEDGQNSEDGERQERTVTRSNTHVSGRLCATSPLRDTIRFARSTFSRPLFLPRIRPTQDDLNATLFDL